MARWQSFAIWKGRWPHWRAEGVTYHVGFKHRRELDESDRHDLFVAMLRAQGKKVDYLCLVVLPERTDALLRVVDDQELSDVVEKAKLKAGKAIIKRTGERFPPFGGESYDRIMRDEQELETVFLEIVDGPSRARAEAADDWPTLFVAPV
ncbi:MAG: hypothetical protein JSS65_12255 [Armatimonadetes bacterium]|nr:hypothetical protein [Armatimonadota bacterium]